MKTFANMKVKAKLLTGFIIMAIIVGIVGIVGITNIKSLSKSDTELYENMTVPIAQVGQISTAFQRMRVNIRDMIVANDPIAIQANADKIAERQAELDTLTAEFESRIVSDEMRTAFDEFVEARKNYKGSLTELIALANQNQDAQAFALMAESGAAGIAARAEQDAIAKLVELKLADGSAKATANTVQANSVVTTMIIVIMLGVLISIVLGVFLGSTISKPLKKAAAMLKEMSMGHLGMRLKMDSKDEIGEMAMSMDSFADDLQNVVIGTMKQISSGDVSANIEIRDEQDEISPALKETIETIRALIVEANMLSQAAVAGQLDTRGNADAFNGGYKEIVEGVNNTLDAVVGPLNVAAEYVDRISKGDIPPKITDSYNGDFNEIKNNLNTCIDAITALVEDADHLAQAGIAGQLDTRADASKHGGDFAKIVDGVNHTLDAVIGPLNVAAEYVDRISKGDIPPKITDSYNGDFNEIKNNLNTCIDAVTALVDDAAMLAQAGIDGRLDTRADASKHGGDFAKIVDGVNHTLDAVIGPLNVAAEYVDRISKGDIPPKITDTYNGDFNEIKNNLNTCIDAITALVEDADHLAQAGIAGQLDTRADASKHGGDFAKIVDGVNNTLDAVIGPLNVAAEYVDRISKGDIPPKITDSYNGDFNEIKNNLNTCIDAVTALVDDAAMLAQAGIDGRLDTRADASKHGGDFAKIVDGVNNTLDAVIGPLNVAAEYVDRISKGDIPPKITDSYNGDFNEIKNNLNTCIDAVTALVDDAAMLAQAGIDGRLDTRADASKHGGDFAKIVDGVNHTLDAVIGPLNVAAEYVDRISKGDIPPKITDSYNGDFNEIKNNLNTCIDAITALVEDADHLAQAGIAGQLDTRADASKHGGDFAKIVDGVNNTLDAVIGPLNVAAEYVDRISKGDIPPKITDSYNGDFNEIKNNLNTCIDAITALVEDADHLAQAGIAGQLDTRADASKHGGDFAKIVDGVNNTLDAVIGPLNVAAEYVDRISKGDIPPKITDSYNGDFNEIKNNLNTCIDAITALVEDADQLAQAGIAGQLDTRADASKHHGDFAKIVEGVNHTLDAVIEPINEACMALKELANGNLNTSMKGQYKGDHAQIKEDLNQTVNSLKRYVKEITGTLEEMGRGNLDQEIKSDYQGDFLNIKIALNDITSQLSATMADIDEAAGQVEAGARQISDGGQALSQGTTEQASSIEQINASISEVAEETKKNAINANEANELAVEVRTNAEVGNGQMDEMVSAMIEINESSQNISKIIKVIDDIAFQTNILALNAAVEAARAGQHGKGFAVVAEEVRTLAARSAEAAKETTGLIEGSINKVEIGTKIADQTAISLKEILSEIERVADLVGNIAHASNEQASEIAQITQAINQVSQVVQTNSATAEESAAASEELSSQSEILMEMVGAFQLKENPNKRNQETGGSKRIMSTGSKPVEPKIVLNDMEYGEIKVDQVRIDKY